MLVSVVLNIMNEEDNIADLLDSLVIQEPPVDVVVVDAASRDRTREIVLRYANKYPFIRLFVQPGSRGVSTNFGISKAQGEVVAFTGGDDIANPNWVKELRRSFDQGADIVAGRSLMIGLKAWEELDRVELLHKGFDCSYPSANIAFRKEILEELGGFDTWFITAEDIDLNYRAVDAGHKIIYNNDAVVYRRTKSTVYAFFKQAFWNGAGRKQLTLKHGNLWGKYDPLKMFKQKMTFWALLRLIVALMGYIGFKLFKDKGPYGRKGQNKVRHQ
ncbi:glycosyltransferase [Methanomassiliicoccus luminyensis]|uniref:glycosyltransferase n=1 Tax=Methanomassiliicoccus luminyensis TaxID=1080712 RepID=UPI000381D725|nr:glycosyltransferase [Methanomassiliicoccus luminyensis]